MLGAYASFLIVLGAAATIGQAILVACGRRGWSPLAPAVGLAALCALAWWTVRLPGEGTAALIAIAIAAAGSALFLRGRLTGAGAGLRRDLVVALAALLVASLPFIVEARFGILGTGLNPDMSQHLFAADRLAAGDSERLIAEGYPLGPHAIVVAVAALGPSTVEAFNGLMLAVAVAACLAPLALLDGLSDWRRAGAALCIGLAYLVAASFVQGSFKETLQALFVLGFAIALLRPAQALPTGEGGAPATLAAVPLAVLAIGSAYAYSFPGLAWLAGALAVWAAIELARATRRGALGPNAASRAAGGAERASVAVAILLLAIAPELGRMAEFASFETFDPAGAGLGNLFDRLSPLEALGIWPSGDFRVEPGDGFAPAVPVLPRGRVRARGAVLRDRLVAAPRRARGTGGAGGRGAALALRAARGHPLSGGKGAGPRGAPGRAGLGPGAGRRRAGGAARRVPARRRRLERSRARQRAGRTARLLARAGRAARPSSAPVRPSSSPRRSCSTTSTASTTCSGSCAATGSASSGSITAISGRRPKDRRCL